MKILIMMMVDKLYIALHFVVVNTLISFKLSSKYYCQLSKIIIRKYGNYAVNKDLQQ